MTEQIKEDVPAFVGVAIGDRVIFNLVDRHGDFPYTGVSIIHALKQNRNKFVADIIQSQSYNSIVEIFDDHLVFGEFKSNNSINYHLYRQTYDFMIKTPGYFYIYDLFNDVIIIKTLDTPEPIGLNYKSSPDVRNFINNTKDGG